jgi:hypothetical protein
MAIRVRRINGITIALCAVESDPKEGDLYLDDAVHSALVTKFSEDYDLGISEEKRVELMQQEKVRDAKEEIERWLTAAPPESERT